MSVILKNVGYESMLFMYEDIGNTRLRPQRSGLEIDICGNSSWCYCFQENIIKVGTGMLPCQSRSGTYFC